MSERPKLSVVTITYKEPAGLRRTVDSLRPLLGTALSWEHVVVDSSPAENVEVLEGLPAGWPLVHVETPPEGVFLAHNAGIRRALGAYLWFLNGGDTLCNPAALTQMLGTLDGAPELDLLCGGADLTRDGRYLYSIRPHANILDGLIGRNAVCHQAILYRQRIFDVVGQFSADYPRAADYDHLLRCYLQKLDIRAVPEILVEFDMGGISNTQWPKVFREFRQIHRRLAPQLPISLVIQNELVRSVDYLRTWTLKSLASSPLAPVLRPLWLSWNRLGDRRPGVARLAVNPRTPTRSS